MDEELDRAVPGPLQQLAPGLRRKAERWPARPIHPRVVHSSSPAGERNLVLASFCAPASARALHAALKPQIEAALLAELSRPPAQLAADASRLAALELYAFAAFPFDPAAALAPFGFSPDTLEDARARQALALLRHEAQHVDGGVSDEAWARFRAPCARAAHPLAEPLARGLRESAAAEAWGVWGSRPGRLARACADLLARLGESGIEPDRRGIERLEAVVVPQTTDVLRWIDPLAFQALCDLVAVAAASSDRAVEWGMCEPDADSALSPPPVLRLVEARGSAREQDNHGDARDRGYVHLPLGEHVLRWCVMPRRAGEQIPTLGAWAEHEFA